MTVAFRPPLREPTDEVALVRARVCLDALFDLLWRQLELLLKEFDLLICGTSRLREPSVLLSARDLRRCDFEIFTVCDVRPKAGAAVALIIFGIHRCCELFILGFVIIRIVLVVFHGGHGQTAESCVLIFVSILVVGAARIIISAAERLTHAITDKRSGFFIELWLLTLHHSTSHVDVDRNYFRDLRGLYMPNEFHPVTLVLVLLHRIVLVNFPLSIASLECNDADLTAAHFVIEVPIHLGTQAHGVAEIVAGVDFTFAVTITTLTFDPVRGLKRNDALLLDLRNFRCLGDVIENL